MRLGAIDDVISAIIYCLINAVDGCGDHATTKPVDVSLCMGAGDNARWNIVFLNLFYIYIYMRVCTKK